ncbi:hypothetical protein F0562_023925 [Nyssa sinensis]|uniref:Uncharacterized protein n=1 Tax=Nyssa sinensis TaxID=561372 RepID=A0A5J5BHQ1_9ASTE|nr:hypothetical protein F0562_023925 [Nyssa sinensis]
MNNIIEAVEHKYQAQGHLEFQVFFNDRVSNDFNTLFINLPPNRKYFAAAVPGSFYGRLFPKASINFIFSSFALQWLSKLPQVVCDLNSPSCNKGRILYANPPKEVGEAYSAQYAEDMEKFLGAPAQELVSGGLMALLIPGRVNGTLPAQSSLGPRFQPLESCLVDMTNEGLLSKDKLDSFNLPIYSPSSEELEKLIEKTECFDIARVEEMHRNNIPLLTMQEFRAGLEGIIKSHFGSEILDELFDRYSKKIAGRPPLNTCGGIGIAFRPSKTRALICLYIVVSYLEQFG